MYKIPEKITKDFAFAYHRTRLEYVEKIIKEGFRPGVGDMYGKGWYFTWDLSSQLRYDMVGSYGSVLIKCRVSMKNVIIFDYNISKDIFGSKYTLVDQLLTHYKIFNHEKLIPYPILQMSRDLEKTFQDPTYSAQIAYNEFVKQYVVNGKVKYDKIYGIVFTGNHDGNVLVSYAYDTAVPYQICTTDEDGQLATDWKSVLDKDAIVRAKRADIALDFFHGRVKRLIIDKYPAEKIKTEFKWLIDAKFKDAIIEITNDGELIWKDGLWINGDWYGDIWENGTWQAGKWYQGEFLTGTWKYGNFVDGTFGAGEWMDGNWSGGTWIGTGYWQKGNLKKGNRFFPINEPPTMNESRAYIYTPEYKKLDSIIEYLLKQSIIEESFKYNNLSQQEKDEMYDEFAKSYKKATGASWDRSHFESRAYGWTFFGEPTGGIAVREQNSGLVKLVAAYGGPKKIVTAYKEMESEMSSRAIWGAMTLNLAQMLEKLSGKKFKIAPKLFVKTVIPHIKHIFGDMVQGVDKDGGILIDTPAGRMKKYFIANKQYYRDILDQAKNNSDKLPIPKPVLKVLVGILKAFI